MARYVVLFVVNAAKENFLKGNVADGYAVVRSYALGLHGQNRKSSMACNQKQNLSYDCWKLI